ncbi:unnamed protein product [Closterium sp. NIES-65]|nr:unnamed protein product [Closterium sp. NIES-65]
MIKHTPCFPTWLCLLVGGNERVSSWGNDRSGLPFANARFVDAVKASFRDYAVGRRLALKTYHIAWSLMVAFRGTAQADNEEEEEEEEEEQEDFSEKEEEEEEEQEEEEQEEEEEEEEEEDEDEEDEEEDEEEEEEEEDDEQGGKELRGSRRHKRGKNMGGRRGK